MSASRGRAADAERQRQRLLGDHLAQRELAVDDGFTQPLGHLGRQGFGGFDFEVGNAHCTYLRLGGNNATGSTQDANLAETARPGDACAEFSNVLGYARSPAEIALMRTPKAAIDPLNLPNPGKIF